MSYVLQEISYLKNDKVKFDVIPKTNKKYISVTYGCMRFIGSFGFLSMGSDELVKSLGVDDFELLEKEFPDKWFYLKKNLAYLYEYFNCLGDYQEPVDNLQKGDHFSKLKNKFSSDDEIERTKEIIRTFDIKKGEELTKFFFKVM